MKRVLATWLNLLAIAAVIAVAVGLLAGAVHIGFMFGPFVGVPAVVLVTTFILAVALSDGADPPESR